jgi:hypothetical protein
MQDKITLAYLTMKKNAAKRKGGAVTIYNGKLN